MSRRRTLNAVVAAAPKRHGLPLEVKEVLEHYYALVADDDLAGDPATLAATALDHLRFADPRRAGRPKVRVFNPVPDTNGYGSPHTVVETVTDDMPFLVDSTTMALDALGHGLHLTIHPRFAVVRDRRGHMTSVSAPPPAGRARVESFIHFEIERQTDPDVLRRIEVELERTLRDVRIAVEDWQPMLERLRDAGRELGESKAPPRELAREGQAFLDWLADDHFTLLGYAEYRLRRGRSADTLERIEGTELGIQKIAEHVPEASRLTGAAQEAARSPLPLVVTKANARSRVHRPVRLDYISVKRFDRQGRPATEQRFLGLFTSAAYIERPRDVPLLRLKVARLAEKVSAEAGTHRGRRLHHVIDTLPRDDLFQGSIDELARIVNGALALQERRRVRLLWRREPFSRFYSFLIYMPRDQYTSRARRRVESLLLEALDGTEVRGEVRLGESSLARLAVTVHLDPGRRRPPEPDFTALERRIAEAVRGFPDRLREALLARYPEHEALELLQRFVDRYSAAYRDEVAPSEAAEDIVRLARIADGESRRELVLRGTDVPTQLRFTVFSRGEAIPLHVALPILENMGVKVRGEGIYTVQLDDGPIFVQAFNCIAAMAVDAQEAAERFCECFARVIDGVIDDDAYNGFVLRAGLDWRDVSMLRAYGKYLAQTNLPYSQDYVHEVLARSPAFVRALAARFHALFDPDLPDDARRRQQRAADRTLAAELDKTETLDVDRILRAFSDAVEATLRTNFFQHDPSGDPKPYIALKLEPSKLPELPEPRPMFEVFVYSQRVEGVHLRASKVARGGIRWSDRREDFRTEVLGLMKAQQVKNAVIVPNGAKGGFVCKRLPEGGDRSAVRAEVVECYRMFIRGLLDVTDNLADGETVHPPRTLRRDGDDTYLVVAADKGTATFSDIANALAEERGYWLGDAFASGGSAGYDHKEMGITARGGWESVKRHFRELGVDTQREPFTVVGIGDMSGDVFGNGMLRSEQIRLVAAFDHRHVFIDPDPNPAESFAERRRLFELPASTWADYDASKLSKGGGVHSRQSKSIELSREAMQALGIEKAKVTPHELIRAVLQAPVDLLWNGGIGTYVKASTEPHTAAGDPTNDAVRVDGRELRCRVVGEGGNLGFTQRGRIEYAQSGGRINTDFIDNSGGVDSSDREVNIKILLNTAVAARALRRGDRDRLLAAMEESIVSGVLANNYAQSQAISVMSAHAAQRLSDDQRLIRALEAEGRLDRALEFLPSDEEIEARRSAGVGLTRPELAIVLAYAKIELTEELVASDIPDDDHCAGELVQYFPPRLRKRFGERIGNHPLRREIIAMLTANSIVNRMGPFFVLRAREEIGASVARIARAYSIVREVFDARRLWRGIEALDGTVPASVQYDALFEIARTLQRAVYWFLQRHADALDIAAMSARFRDGVQQLAAALPRADSSLARRYTEEAARLEASGLPRAIARHIASLAFGTQALEIAQHALERRADPVELGALHLEIGARVGFDTVRDGLEQLHPQNRWQSIARAQLYERLASAQRDVLAGVLDSGGRLDRWLASTGAEGERIRTMRAELESAPSVDIAALSVMMREFERLASGYNREP